MNDALQIALLASIGPILAALAALWQGFQAKQISKETLVQTKEIHVMVNNNLSEVKAALAAANARIESLVATSSATSERLEASIKIIGELTAAAGRRLDQNSVTITNAEIISPKITDAEIINPTIVNEKGDKNGKQ